jgi:hypothetical protein
LKGLTAGAVEPVRRRVGRRVAGAIVVSLLATVALLGAGAPVASAAPEAGPGWVYKANFGAGVNFFFETPRNPVAVDGNGNIFGADQESGAIHVSSPSADGGTPLTDFQGGLLRNIAVDPSDGTVYVDEVFGGPLRRYVSDGAPTPTYSVDPAFEVTQGDGIAVDPTTGNLLVADPGAEGVRRYDTSGTLLETIATPSLSPAWIVAAPDGSFYVAPSEGPDVTHFSGAGTLLGTISGAGSPHGLSYDPSRSVVVVAVGNRLKSYSPAGALLAESPSHDGQGLAISASGSLYQAEGTLAYYAPGTMPGVEAPQVSAIATHSVHVSAEVDPGAGPPEGSVAHFEYSADGGQTWPDEFKTPDVSVKRTDTEEPAIVEADLAGLKGNADYLVRLVAGNSVMTTTSSATPFHTPLTAPEVETGPAISIANTTAQLTGTIDTLGDQTTYRFEYGLTTSYGTSAPGGAEAVAGNERSPRTFSREISGLQPNTTYHYRLVAKNSVGEAVGEDRTFTTSGAAPARVYEQVSPSNKEGGLIQTAVGFQTAADGSEIAYQFSQAPADASGAVLFSRVLSRRSSTGWLDWQPLDPPIKTETTITETVTHAVSPDFTHTMVVSNRVLAPGAIDGGGNIYIQDLDTGEYTFVGGAPGASAFRLMSGIQTENMYLAGASDFSWIVFLSPASLQSEAPPTAMYRWSATEGLALQSSSTASVQLPDAGNELTSRYVSDDGNVMYYDLQDGDGAVYRHDLGGATTPISVAEAESDYPEGMVVSAKLDGISRDGRYAIIRTQGRLTADNPPTFSNAWLYRVDSQSGDIELIGQPSNLSPGDVYAVGDDAKTVHFHYEKGGSRSWREGVTHAFTASELNHSISSGPQRFASPNGRYLAYVDPIIPTVHLYDAEAQTDVCVSCPPGGGLGARDYGLPFGTRTVSNRTPEIVNNEGEMYFDTSYPLVAEDHNATRDVYQYHEGQLTLISPGDGPYVARFADATPDGSDVFFTTDEALVPGDVDRGVDVYDARIGGGFPETGTTTSECEGEACLSPIGRPPDLDTPKGGEDTTAPFAISNLRSLSPGDRKKLAYGGKAHLRLTVSRPGTVTVTGRKIAGSPVKAKKAGGISVPFALAKPALSELRTKGKLAIKFSVHFGDASPKVVHLTLYAAAPKKGGRS